MLFVAVVEWIDAIVKADTQGAIINRSLTGHGQDLMGERLLLSINSKVIS